MELSKYKAFQLGVLNELTAAAKVAEATNTEAWPELRDAVAIKYGLGDAFDFIELG